MSTCRFAKTLVLLHLSLLVIYCLTMTARAERLPIKTYTTADGLAHNAVNRIVRDSRGFLWFCTFEGLSYWRRSRTYDRQDSRLRPIARF